MTQNFCCTNFRTVYTNSMNEKRQTASHGFLARGNRGLGLVFLFMLLLASFSLGALQTLPDSSDTTCNGVVCVGTNWIDLQWYALENYPSGCGAGEAVQVIGDTLTCISVSSGGSDGNVFSIGIIDKDTNQFLIDVNSVGRLQSDQNQLCTDSVCFDINDLNISGSASGGSNTQVQYNDGGSFGGDNNFTWDAVNNELQVIGSVGAGTTDPSFFTSPANGFKAEYNGDGDPFFCWERDNAVSEVDRQYCFYVAANSGFLTLRDVTAGDNLIYWDLDSLTTIDGNLTFDDDGDSLIVQNNNYAFRTTGSAGFYFDNAGGEFEFHTPSGVPVFIVDITGADAGTGTFNNNLTVLGDINAHNSGTVASDLTSTDGFTNQRKTSYENSSTHNLFTAFAARGTDTSPTILQNDDQIDSWRFRGYDGSDFRDAASINVEIDGTPGSSDMPGRIVFSTTPDGASSVSEVLRLNADQSSRFSGDASVLGDLNVLTNVSIPNGDLAVGHSSPSANIHTLLTNSGNIASQIYIENDANAVGTGSGFLFVANDSTNADTFYGGMSFNIADATNGSEDGNVNIREMVNGTLTNVLTFSEFDATFNHSNGGSFTVHEFGGGSTQLTSSGFIQTEAGGYNLQEEGTRVMQINNTSVAIGSGATASGNGALQVVNDELRVGDSGTPGVATGDGDLYVEDALEVDGAAHGIPRLLSFKVDGSFGVGGFLNFGKTMTGELPAIRTGSITGMAIEVDIDAMGDCSAFNLAIFDEGTNVWATEIGTGTGNNQEVTNTQARGTDTFSVGDDLEARIVAVGCGGLGEGGGTLSDASGYFEVVFD